MVMMMMPKIIAKVTKSGAIVTRGPVPSSSTAIKIGRSYWPKSKISRWSERL